jgi:putative addiction module CopG family antidote
MHDLHVTLPDEIVELIQQQIDSGDYADASAVIADALHCRFENELSDLETAALRLEVTPRIESLRHGDVTTYSVAEALEEVERALAEMPDDASN